ncbi:hypothetical protein KQX54_017908 [Cotesia glomerata]|uniref:Uncharacterized protein n=1 Tax=Cotesia glomerata TaxID=32391 RepID=A0AAV7IXU9_COTGL|nr:hypothetical protein KQX54_017908 [Cotesia glomerata]
MLDIEYIEIDLQEEEDTSGWCGMEPASEVVRLANSPRVAKTAEWEERVQQEKGHMLNPCIPLPDTRLDNYQGAPEWTLQLHPPPASSFSGLWLGEILFLPLDGEFPTRVSGASIDVHVDVLMPCSASHRLFSHH